MPSARRRGVWLGINLATAFLAAWVVGLFEATIQQIVALAVLMPIVASMGGVAATQTLTLIVRGLALGQIERANARWLLTKEIAVALLNGLAWATVVAFVVLAWFHQWRIALVIFAAMVVNLLAAALAGVTVPLALKRFGVDPGRRGRRHRDDRHRRDRLRLAARARHPAAQVTQGARYGTISARCTCASAYPIAISSQV